MEKVLLSRILNGPDFSIGHLFLVLCEYTQCKEETAKYKPMTYTLQL